jgi:hypothetical protein
MVNWHTILVNWQEILKNAWHSVLCQTMPVNWVDITWLMPQNCSNAGKCYVIPVKTGNH